MRWFAALLVVPLALSGCTLLQEPEVRALAGPTDGYTPTASFLKVHVKRDDGSVAYLAFDRRDWYASEIAHRLDVKEIRFVDAQALPRDILNEYLAQSVMSPEDLQKLKFDDMGATPEQRAQMDSEYERLLQEFLAQAPTPPETPQVPTKMLPEAALP